MSRTPTPTETLEAGLVLRGTELKSLRTGQVNFKDSYATVRNGEAWLLGCRISPHRHGTDANHDPERDRKLLLHAREIRRLVGKIAERRLTVVPLKLSFKAGRAKIEIGRCTTSARPSASGRPAARWIKPPGLAGTAAK